MLDFFATTLTRCLGFTLRIFPAFIVYAFADLAAFIMYVVVRLKRRKAERRNRGMFRNFNVAFGPDLDPRTQRRLVWGCCRHMVYSMVDFLRMPLITEKSMDRIVDNSDMQIVWDLRERGKGVICGSGHHGNWELSGHLEGLNGGSLHTVIRPMPMRKFDAYITKIRSWTGQVIIKKIGALLTVAQHLRENKLIAIMADENTSKKKYFVRFFGTMASANASIAILHQKTEAPIIIGSYCRVGRFKYKLHIWKVIQYEPQKNGPGRIQEILQEVAEGIETGIRAYPDQWFWGMRRWKTRPGDEELGETGLPPRVEPPELPSLPPVPGMSAVPSAALSRLRLEKGPG